jgi:hypothetical protein
MGLKTRARTPMAPPKKTRGYGLIHNPFPIFRKFFLTVMSAEKMEVNDREYISTVCDHKKGRGLEQEFKR